MVFNYRFFDQVLTAQRLIAERGLGAPTAVSAFVHGSCWSHCLDLIALLAGPAASVSAIPDAEGGGRLSVAFTTSRGATGTVVRALTGGFFHPLYELTVGFTHGRIHLRGLDGELELLDYRAGGVAERVMPSHTSSQWVCYERSFARSLEAWLAAIRSGAPPPVPGEAGLHELRFEAAIARSIRLGRRIKLKQELPIDAAMQEVS
jgi:predicted dehydrogenase